MFDLDFWGEPISVYTDADAIEDGTLTDIAFLGVKFNGSIVSRITGGAAAATEILTKEPYIAKIDLQTIADGCTFDGEGVEAWGIFQPDRRFGGEKLWLVYNEIGGYTIMLPSEY